jgi:hypothetical protein
MCGGEYSRLQSGDVAMAEVIDHTPTIVTVPRVHTTPCLGLPLSYSARDTLLRCDRCGM